MKLKFFFANFRILGPLGCQGWVIIPQNVEKADCASHQRKVFLAVYVEFREGSVQFASSRTTSSVIPVGLDSKIFLAVYVELREGPVHTPGLPEVRPSLPQRDYLCHHWCSS
jgi:hypothetical protein